MSTPSQTVPEGIGALAAIARQALAQIGTDRTPLLLFDRSAVAGQVALWRACLPEVVAHYAVKVNDFPPLLRQLQDAGVAFDAATAGELDLLASLGVASSQVLATHPIRGAQDLGAVRRHRPRALVVQDVAELDKLQQAGVPGPDYAPELLIRIKLEFSNLNKFGVEGVFQPVQRADGRWTWTLDARPIVALLDAARRVEAQNGARFGGFGFAGHVGTNTPTAEPWRMMLASFRYLHEKLLSHGFRVDRFDLGGGYCDPEIAAWHGTSQEALLRAIGEAVRACAAACPGVTFLAEPGRFMVSHALTLVTRVKSARSKSWRIERDASGVGGLPQVQAGEHLVVHMDDSIYGTLLGQAHDDKQWRFHALRLAGEPLAEATVPALIWGSTCDSWDRIHGDRPLPRNLREGDYLLVPHVGAYTMSTRTDFNRMAPQHVFAHDGAGAAWELYEHTGRLVARAEAGPR